MIRVRLVPTPPPLPHMFPYPLRCRLLGVCAVCLFSKPPRAVACLEYDVRPNDMVSHSIHRCQPTYVHIHKYMHMYACMYACMHDRMHAGIIQVSCMYSRVCAHEYTD